MKEWLILVTQNAIVIIDALALVIIAAGRIEVSPTACTLFGRLFT